MRARFTLLAVGIEELPDLRGRPGGPGHRAGDHPGNQSVLPD